MIAALLGLILDPDPSPDALRRALRIPALAAGWRERFDERLGVRFPPGRMVDVS